MKFILIFILILFIYAIVVEPNILTVKKITIKNENLKGLKIVFAADFHFKPFEEYRLKRIVKRINEQNPDIILLGGDYVNGHKKGNTLNLNIIAGEFSKLKSKYGTVAIMGNHDGWQGWFDIKETLKSADIEVLDNNRKDYGGFIIAGVKDLQTSKPDIKKALCNSGGCDKINFDKPVIFLTHSPDIIEDVPETVSLVLAGHTHGGQVSVPFKGPLIVPSKYGTQYAYGFFEKERLYVTRGLGTSILPLRFNCFPEIVVIEFE